MTLGEAITDLTEYLKDVGTIRLCWGKDTVENYLKSFLGCNSWDNVIGTILIITYENVNDYNFDDLKKDKNLETDFLKEFFVDFITLLKWTAEKAEAWTWWIGLQDKTSVGCNFTLGTTINYEWHLTINSTNQLFLKIENVETNALYYHGRFDEDKVEQVLKAMLD